jgi:hypothetical protein
VIEALLVDVLIAVAQRDQRWTHDCPCSRCLPFVSFLKWAKAVALL